MKSPHESGLYQSDGWDCPVINTILQEADADRNRIKELALKTNLNHLTALLTFLFVIAIHFAASVSASPPGGALSGDRPRVVISSDIGGSDPDDFQSLIHLLLYADVIDVEGLISSPPEAGRAKHILEVIDAYANDYSHLKSHSKAYPAADALRSVVKQGALDKASQKGWSEPTDGSRWIIQRAHAADKRPLWILVWGSITDVAQAIHDDPSIKSHIRVYSIGSWNTSQDSAARDYLFKNHTDLWWIESDTSFRGMYMGGLQDDDWGNLSFIQQNVKGHGSLGDLFFKKKHDIKMGDTPSFLYLLRGNPDDPTSPHWGGAFVATGHGKDYWTDNPDPSLSTSNRAGAKTVSNWRREYLEDWKYRMDRVNE
ncbi:Inosine-uridine preferring nucleoside hydrolase [Roseimaritima multifibrata]|uniref:Inosine-uridine preferring nucleoside hydrolase n=2 Tax=Roseimaritima multifibrata TaxID=1930274 RepID=A0A517MA97_9BACT|nr:Inosine-uridine preferring nucleoside hydrolase [Roseimaritima multifibrata]